MQAFIWEDTTGMQNLRDLVAAQGVNLNGWMLQEATGVSANGRVIVGNGTNPQGAEEGWVVNLGPACAANCDRSTGTPRLTANDYQCFLAQYVSSMASPICLRINSYANCDGSSVTPVLTANDFQCFTGCS